jgi:cytochrome P450
MLALYVLGALLVIIVVGFKLGRARVLYEVSFEHAPGPGRFSGKETWSTLLDLMQKFGPVFRLENPRALLIGQHDLIKFATTWEPEHYDRDAELLRPALQDLLGPAATSPNASSVWEAQRRLYKGISEAGEAGFAWWRQSVRVRIEEFLKRLETSLPSAGQRQQQVELDLAPALEALSFELGCVLVLGQPLLPEEEAARVRRELEAAGEAAFGAAANKTREAASSLRAALGRAYGARESPDADEASLAACLRREGQLIQTAAPELLGALAFAHLAGRAALCSLVGRLGGRTDLQEQLAALATGSPSGGDSGSSSSGGSEPEIDATPLLRAVIYEALRLDPPMPFLLPRRLVRPRPVEWVHAEKLWMVQAKEGTRILLAPGVVHRNPRLHPQPELFRPERWLDPVDPPLPHAGHFMPFSQGPRRCPAERFVLEQLRSLALLFCSRFRIESTSPPSFTETGFGFLRPVAVPVKLRRA